MRISKLFTVLAATALLAAGCTSQQEPATKAIKSAEAALAEIRTDAAKFAPAELQSAEASLAMAKGELATKDYKAVLADTAKLNAEINTLKEVVISRQTQNAAATNEWESLSAKVPKVVDAIQIRVDSLAGSSRLPAEVSKEAFEAAKAGLVTMKSTWAEASAAFSAGNAIEATDKARLVESKAKELTEQLGMNPM